MFRFFRQIRHRLFQEGKASRYLGYAIGEIVLIVVGIMIAVQIGEWKQEQRDRIEERETLGRIYDELDNNIARMASGAQGAPSWIEMIDRLISAFDGEPIKDNIAFLNDAAEAGSFSVRRQVKSTYAELLSSGRFGLIQNVELRNLIFDYYDSMVQNERRADERRGDYAGLAYKLIPRGGSDLREGLSDEEYAMIVQVVLSSDLRSHLLYERNRGEFTKEMFGNLIEIASELQTKIQAELAN